MFMTWLTSLPRLAQWWILCFGLLFFFSLCAYIEELTFRYVKGFHYSGFVTCFELLFFSLISALERYQSPDGIWYHKVSMKNHVYIAVAMMLGRGTSNKSLEFLNYPTQVIFKSLKLLAIILGSVLINGKKYAVEEYVSALFLVVSAIMFSLGDRDVDDQGLSASAKLGLFLVTLSLVFDSFHANLQEHILQASKVSLSETIFYSNFIGFLITFVGIVFSGELMESLKFFFVEGYLWVFWALCAKAFMVYAGVICMTTIVKLFSAVMSHTIATIRKVLTVLLSFLFFPKPFTTKYLFALLMFSVGLFINLQTLKTSEAAKASKEKAVAHLDKQDYEEVATEERDTDKIV